MKKDLVEFTGYVSEGMLIIRRRKDFDIECKRFEGNDVDIVVSKKKSIRSSPQNRYYWAVVVPAVRDGLNDMGHDVNKEDVHDFIKATFNYKEIVNETTGEVFRLPLSTTRLNKSEFGELIEKVMRFASEYLNVVIPEANASLRLID